MSRLVKDGCMPKVFNVLELVLWHSKCFDATRRVIHISEVGFPLVSLIPIVFQKMLRLSKLNKELKLAEANSFIANNGGLKKLRYILQINFWESNPVLMSLT